MPQAFSQLCRHPLSATIEAACEPYVGVRWIPGGNTLQGVDCIGLVIATAFEIGLYDKAEVEIPRYKQIPSGNQMLHTLSQYLKRVPRPMRGCVVTFSQTGTSLYHVGIIGDNHFYHAALEHKKVVKTSITDNVLKGRKACFVFERPTSDGISEATTTSLAVEGAANGGIES